MLLMDRRRQVRLMGQAVGCRDKDDKRLIGMGGKAYKHVPKLPIAHILIIGDYPIAIGERAYRLEDPAGPPILQRTGAHRYELMGTAAVYACDETPILGTADCLHLAPVACYPVAFEYRSNAAEARELLLLSYPLIEKLIGIWYVDEAAAAAASCKIAMPSHLIPFMRATISALDVTASRRSRSGRKRSGARLLALEA